MDSLRAELLESGASVAGFADVGGIVKGDIAHLDRAISIGVIKKLNEDTVHLLGRLQKIAAIKLKERGYRYLCIPPDSDRAAGEKPFISRLYPLFTHKVAATLSGLGWIGKNGLLISPVHGSRISLATVLTDAPLKTGQPIINSLCGECTLCIDHCPSQAITGRQWCQEDPYAELVRIKRCAAHKKNSRPTEGKPNCGLCINICPFSRNNMIKPPRRVEAALAEE